MHITLYSVYAQERREEPVWFKPPEMIYQLTEFRTRFLRLELFKIGSV